MALKILPILISVALLLIALASTAPLKDEERHETGKIASFFKDFGLKFQLAYNKITKCFKDFADKIKEYYSKFAKIFANLGKTFEKAYADIAKFFTTIKNALGFGNKQHHVLKRHAIPSSDLCSGQLEAKFFSRNFNSTNFGYTCLQNLVVVEIEIEMRTLEIWNEIRRQFKMKKYLL